MRLAAALAVAALCLGAPAAGAEPLPTFDQIVERLNSVNPTLKTLIVEQDAVVRWLGLFRFLVRTTVYASRPANYKVVVHEAPAILRPLGNTFHMISSPEQALADYRAASIRPGSDNTLLVELAASRPSVNPPSGTVVINSARWLLQETILRYEWGELQTRYHYEEIDGYLLPTTVDVSIPGYALHADLTYTNYQLNIALPPDIFATQSAP